MRIPHAEPGMRIGLFGGSFNPPHEGHVHASLLALKRARLHRIWWLVTPGNPLKDSRELESLETRLERCHALVRHPAIDVTAIEAGFDTRYTEETLSRLMTVRPRLDFVWIMGADNLASFHRWQNWRRIAAMMPMIVIDRPGSTLSFLHAPAAIALSRYRIDEDDCGLISRLKPPAWTFLHGPRSPLSSTAIREKRRQSRG